MNVVSTNDKITCFLYKKKLVTRNTSVIWLKKRLEINFVQNVVKRRMTLNNVGVIALSHSKKVLLTNIRLYSKLVEGRYIK